MSRRCHRRGEFPPRSLTGMEPTSAGAFLALHRVMKAAPVALVLGSGASAADGAPTWQALVRRICESFFCHLDVVQTRRGIPAGRISIAFTEEYFADERSRAHAASVMAHDPILGAQLIQNCVRPADWNYLVRKLIYRGTTFSAKSQLRVIAKICQMPETVSCVINLNYDDLFERHLRALGVKYEVLTDMNPAPRSECLPVYHPHGWLPQQGGSDAPIVLSETDYLFRVSTPYSWADTLQVVQYALHSAVFVGTSLTDPHVRHLLRATSRISRKPHFAFLPQDSEVPGDSTAADALFDRDLSTMRIKVVRYPVQRSPSHRHRNLWALLRLLSEALSDEGVLWSAGPRLRHG